GEWHHDGHRPRRILLRFAWRGGEREGRNDRNGLSQQHGRPPGAWEDRIAAVRGRFSADIEPDGNREALAAAVRRYRKRRGAAYHLHHLMIDAGDPGAPGEPH